MRINLYLHMENKIMEVKKKKCDVIYSAPISIQSFVFSFNVEQIPPCSLTSSGLNVEQVCITEVVRLILSQINQLGRVNNVQIMFYFILPGKLATILYINHEHILKIFNFSLTFVTHTIPVTCYLSTSCRCST